MIHDGISKKVYFVWYAVRHKISHGKWLYNGAVLYGIFDIQLETVGDGRAMFYGNYGPRRGKNEAAMEAVFSNIGSMLVFLKCDGNMTKIRCSDASLLK